MISGYVLINAEKGRALNLVEKLVRFKGVKSACAVTGAYDIIATFEVENPAEIGQLVCKRIQGLKEVTCTQTLVCSECKTV
ncbi:MAG: Lrp/AsnC ligand binding domain-containing protein [Thermoproteota archaeon]